MGYRSDVVIGINKEVLAMDLISPIIPAVLKEMESQSTDNSVYWKLSGWKWYDSYADVKAIEDFFSELDEKETPEQSALYGAVRIGEDDDDTEFWGSPSDFDIYLSRSIDCPV